MSPASDSPPASNPSWRYGVYLFPIPPLLLVVTYATVSLFTVAAQAESPLLAIGAFAATVLTGWVAYLIAAVVAVALAMDALALRDHPAWNPNPWLAAVLGVVHFGGAFLAVPYLASVPGISYYVYRRRQSVDGDGNGGHDGERGSIDPSSGEYST
ncbi:hypothetical protein [Natrinema ejinorense]|uniref:hypothetical protein n=1 Tax=Natrinema ejinorense TaxID=373386 RepID=UPI001FE3E613|nr:hypothetical protein [Natrinema ejinorense]